VAEVRPALPADAERCALLCQNALAEVQQARGGPLFARREASLVARALLRPGGLERLMVEGKRRVMVGAVGDAVVGFAAGHIEHVGDVSLGVIDVCYVEPGKRRLAVGRSLLGGLIEWYRTLSCKGIDGPALPGDRAMKQLYESAGFKARLITMYRESGTHDAPTDTAAEP
jgi:GNAT superfamily N-acetyltransferase